MLLVIGCALTIGLVVPMALNLVHDRSTQIEGTPRPVERRSRRESLEPLRGTIASAAALRNPPWILFGAYDSGFPSDLNGLTQLERGVGFSFPILSFHSAWGDSMDQQFPALMLDTIDKLGSIPMITWEPYLSNFGRPMHNLPPREERDYASLAAIARGDYDFYVVPWAEAAGRFRKPIFLRFASSMNDPYRYPWGPQNGNRPGDFIAAWRRLREIFDRSGATNVIWVWSPNVSMPWLEEYYPGNEFVDWVGMGVLNYGNSAKWSRWWSLDQILAKPYAALATIPKPVMICEFGTLASGGDPMAWYRDAFRSIGNKYHRIRGIVIFNQRGDWNWSVAQNREMAAYVGSELSRLAPR